MGSKTYSQEGTVAGAVAQKEWEGGKGKMTERCRGECECHACDEGRGWD